ncbi:MAG: cellulase family glycosylhydrolase [Deltaproteobacteria bacterium]|nr:cellulase family glycosylhydrolase [Deltaproteobacteria bacterium]
MFDHLPRFLNMIISTLFPIVAALSSPAVRADDLFTDFESNNPLFGWKTMNASGADVNLGLASGQGRNNSTCAKLTFDFTGGGSYVGMGYKFYLAKQVEGISFWLKHYPAGSEVLVRLGDSTGQTIQFGVPIKTMPNGWTHYRVLTGGGESYWDGANDNRFHGGLKEFWILVDKRSGFHRSGSIMIDDVAFIKSRAVEFDPFDQGSMKQVFEDDPRNRLGVNVHFAAPENNQLDLASQAGFGFIRMDMFWQAVEPSPGHFNFTAYDKLVAALASRSMKAFLILDYGNPSYYDGPQPYEDHFGPASSSYRSAYVSYAAAAARHFKGKDVTLEVWNEPNIAFFWEPGPNTDAYAALASQALAAIAKEAPGMHTAVFATSMVDLTFIQAVLSKLDPSLLDWISVHPYRVSLPESFYEEVAAVEEAARDSNSGTDIPVISSEWGYTTTSFGGNTEQSLQLQARYAVRELLYNLMVNRLKVVWYDLVNDGNDPQNGEHNFGLLWHDTLEPKPAYLAVKTFADLRPAGTCRVYRIDSGLSHVFGMLMSGTNSDVSTAVIWETRPNTQSTVNVQAPGVTAFYDMYGNQVQDVTCRDNTCALTLTEDMGPVYIKRNGGCTPGKTESCEKCGTRTCNSEGHFGPCLGKGTCSPDDTGNEKCGDCGFHERSCKDDCTWGEWNKCSPDPATSCGSNQTCDDGGMCICLYKECSGECCNKGENCIQGVCTGSEQDGAEYESLPEKNRPEGENELASEGDADAGYRDDAAHVPDSDPGDLQDNMDMQEQEPAESKTDNHRNGSSGCGCSGTPGTKKGLLDVLFLFALGCLICKMNRIL